MESLTKGISELLVDPKYSDLEIRCDGKIFKVHRVVVCSRSPVMAKECDGGFLEAQTRVIEHKTFDAGTLDRMLNFMYRGDYDVEEKQKEKKQVKGKAAAASESGPWFSSALSPFASMESAGILSMEPYVERSELIGEGEMRYTAITFLRQYQHVSFEEMRMASFKYETSLPKSAACSRDQLLAHVAVYAIADYYQVAELKKLAHGRFTGGVDMWTLLRENHFLDIIAAVYGQCPVEQGGLREQMVALACRWPNATGTNPRFMEAMVNRGDLQDFMADWIMTVSSRM